MLFAVVNAGKASSWRGRRFRLGWALHLQSVESRPACRGLSRSRVRVLLPPALIPTPPVSGTKADEPPQNLIEVGHVQVRRVAGLRDDVQFLAGEKIRRGPQRDGR